MTQLTISLKQEVCDDRRPAYCTGKRRYTVSTGTPNGRASQDLCTTLFVARSVIPCCEERAPALHESATCESSLQDRRAWWRGNEEADTTTRREFVAKSNYYWSLLGLMGLRLLCSLRPQLLCPPAGVVTRCLAVPGVSESPCLFRVAQVGLLDDVWDDDYEAEVLPCNFVVEVVCF